MASTILAMEAALLGYHMCRTAWRLSRQVQHARTLYDTGRWAWDHVRGFVDPTAPPSTASSAAHTDDDAWELLDPDVTVVVAAGAAGNGSTGATNPAGATARAASSCVAADAVWGPPAPAWSPGRP